jgi:hypothetical protein
MMWDRIQVNTSELERDVGVTSSAHVLNRHGSTYLYYSAGHTG